MLEKRQKGSHEEKCERYYSLALIEIQSYTFTIKPITNNAGDLS